MFRIYGSFTFITLLIIEIGSGVKSTSLESAESEGKVTVNVPHDNGHFQLVSGYCVHILICAHLNFLFSLKAFIRICHINYFQFINRSPSLTGHVSMEKER